MTIRVVFVAHAGIEEQAITYDFEDDEAGKRKVRQMWEEECDEGLDYREKARPAVEAWLAGTWQDPSPFSLCFACDYGYIAVDWWQSSTALGFQLEGKA